MRLSIVIPTWNAWDMLSHTLAALQPAIEAVKDAVEVIVVDDGGDDPTSAMLQQDYRWVRLVRRDENGGFSAACNSGMAAARGTWVLLLNNDMVPADGAIEALLQFAEGCDDDVFAVRPAIVKVRELDAEAYAHLAMQFDQSRGMLRCRLVTLAESTADWESFPVCSGGAGVFRRAMLDELGGFDEIFSPFYWEDVDLSYRALMRGWRILYHPAALFRHAETGSIRRSYRLSRIERISQRNAYLFHWLNLSDPRMLLAHFAWLPFQLVKGLVPGQQWRLLAFGDALARLGEVIQGRRMRKAVRHVADREIVRGSRQGEVVKIWLR